MLPEPFTGLWMGGEAGWASLLPALLHPGQLCHHLSCLLGFFGRDLLLGGWGQGEDEKTTVPIQGKLREIANVFPEVTWQ